MLENYSFLARVRNKLEVPMQVPRRRKMKVLYFLK